MASRIVVAVTVALVALTSGCSSDQDPVCEALSTLQGSVSSLGDISLGQGALADLQGTVSQIETDLQGVREAAEQEFGTEVESLGSAITTLSDDVKSAIQSPSADSISGLGTDVSAVQQAWDALRSAAPDCDL